MDTQEGLQQNDSAPGLVWCQQTEKAQSTAQAFVCMLGFACMESSGNGESFTLNLELLPPACPNVSCLLSLLAVSKTFLT